jgi:hypothetical protein
MKVLYILGFARCGSTILGNLLGEIPGFIHVGELDRFWMRLSRAGRKCGCGVELTECGVWSNNLARIQERFPNGGSSEEASHQKHWVQWVQDLRAVAIKEGGARLPRRADDPRAQLYRQIVEETLGQIETSFSAKVIVDSSKLPAAGLLLKEMPNVQPYFLHLIRDPRGAVLSRQKRKAKKTEGMFDLKLRSTILDSLRWLQSNRAGESIKNSRNVKYLRLSYERLITSPHGTLLNIMEFLGESPTNSPLIDKSRAWLRENHTVGGNRNRFKSGEIELRIDDTWVSTMKRRDCLLVTALTFPLLTRYHYTLKRSYPPQPNVIT